MMMDYRGKKMAGYANECYSMSSSLMSPLPNTLSSHNNYFSLSGNTITNVHGQKI
jgi:hypothetical protein